MPSPGMLCHVALIRTDILEEHIVFLRSMLRLLVTANIVPTPIIVTLMMEVICSSKTLVLTSCIQHNIPEDGILDICL
jgi:hypothetical protein